VVRLPTDLIYVTSNVLAPKAPSILILMVLGIG